MSDPVQPVAGGGKVIRLDQWIKRRQRATCAHIEVVIDDDHPSLECVTCGAEVDPYHWIRKLAERAEEWAASWDAVQQDKLAAINREIERHNAMVADRNELIRKLTHQVSLLEQRKYSLKGELGDKPRGRKK